MASNKITGENSNTSGGDDHFSEVDETVLINPMVLLVRIEYVNGRPIEPEILTETTFHELCLYANSSYEPYAVESPHEICITYRQGVSLGQVAGELMVIESWRDFPILITIVIIKRLKVDSIVEVRQKYRQEQKDRELKGLEKLKQGQYDLQEEFEQMAAQKSTLKQQMVEQDAKQGNLLKAVEQLTEKLLSWRCNPFSLKAL